MSNPTTLHMVNPGVYLNFMHLLPYTGHIFAMLSKSFKRHVHIVGY